MNNSKKAHSAQCMPRVRVYTLGLYSLTPTSVSVSMPIVPRGLRPRTRTRMKTTIKINSFKKITHT